VETASPAAGRKLVCPLCGKSAVSADELLKHARAAHANRPVFRIRIHRIRIHVFFGLRDPDPDPLVRGMDPDPALDPDPFFIMQK
jgi:hypothetical protein